MISGTPDRAPRYVRADGRHCLHAAGWVMQDARTLVENGCVEVRDGQIIHVHSRTGRGTVSHLPLVDHGPGLLMPPLVNAHTHLELSALVGQLPFDLGFEAWVKTLLQKRAGLSESDLVRAAETAISTLEGPVGEISTLGITRDVLAASGTAGVFFQEYLGGAVPESLIGLEKGVPLSVSHAGHAPHTTAPELLALLKEKSRGANLPFSIHLAESGAESAFIAGEGGGWYEFLVSRNIDPSAWPVGDKSPVAYAHGLGLLDDHTLAVHLIRLEKGDLELLAGSGTRVCLCPRSNWNLHGRLPDLPALLDKGLAPALGTDSLASCDSLSLLDEMAFIREMFPEIRPEDLLDMATRNGAAALGLSDRYGVLAPGYAADFLYVNTGANRPDTIIERITHHV